jgi:hypothetical protein
VQILVTGFLSPTINPVRSAMRESHALPLAQVTSLWTLLEVDSTRADGESDYLMFKRTR